MPAKSIAPRKFFGWAKSHPAEAKSEGKYPAGMTQQQMGDYASTSEKGLPQTAPKKRKYYGQK